MTRPFAPLLFVGVLLLAPLMAVAHGDKAHVMGTVIGTGDGSLTIKDTHGKTIVLRVDAETRYVTLSGAEAAEPPAVGTRVVVDVAGDGQTLTATRVRFVPGGHPHGAAPGP